MATITLNKTIGLGGSTETITNLEGFKPHSVVSYDPNRKAYSSTGNEPIVVAVFVDYTAAYSAALTATNMLNKVLPRL